MICDGGLASCVICRGGEGSLPTDCPGEQMHDAVENAVYDGLIDYDAKLGWVQRDAGGVR